MGGTSIKTASAAGSFTSALGEPQLDALTADPAAKMPTSTQIGYEDEETAKAKERLMSKMLGTTSVTTRKSRQEKLSIGDLSGLNADILAGGVGGGELPEETMMMF